MKLKMAVISMALLTGGATVTACAADAGATETGATYSTLDAAALDALIQSDKVVLVDVRTAEEFADGHLASAIHMPLDQFDPTTLPKVEGKETILYCRSDNRSGKAAKAYVETTGRSIRHLDGGILAWEAAGLPVQK